MNVPYLRRWLAATTAVAVVAAILTSPAGPTWASPSETPSAPNLLTNPGFESGLAGWSTSGTSGAAYTQTSNPHSGNGNLAFWHDGSWSVDTVQTVSGLTAGTYLFSAWVKNWGVTSAGLEAYNCGDTKQTVDLPVTSSWRQVTLVVSVRSTSSCTVGVWARSNTSSIAVDDVTFSKTTPGAGGPMATGGDINYRRMTAAMGGRWADSAGVEKDVLDILAAKNFNLARIRIYNKPGNFVQSGGKTYQLQPGWQDLADAVQNAKDAKARGMQLLITVYYSDFWDNGAPVAWRSYNQSQLETATYDWTRNVMTTLQANGVTPEYVAIGNEMQSQIVGVSRSQNPAGYYGLLKKGVAGVRSVSPTTKTVVHLRTSSGLADKNTYTSWIQGAATYGLNYDVFGMSLYPFYTNSSIASMANFASWASKASGKPAMVAEVGHPWTLNAQAAGEQTLIQMKGADPDGPENYGASPSGQRRYLQEYFRAMYSTGNVLGVIYWDPIWIDLGNGRPGPDRNGWVVGGDVEVEDTTLFNYGNPHVATAGLDAFNTW